MRPGYSAALRDLLEDVVRESTTGRRTDVARPARAWRTAGVTALVAAAVVTVSAVVVLHAPGTRSPQFAARSTETVPPTSSPAQSSSPAGTVDLGAIHWSRPEATANPTSTIWISEDWEPLHSVRGTCGIAGATPTAVVSADGTVTISVRGYGYSAAGDVECTLERVDPGPVPVHLSRVVQVRRVVDASTGISFPLGIAAHPGEVPVVTATPTP